MINYRAFAAVVAVALAAANARAADTFSASGIGDNIPVKSITSLTPAATQSGGIAAGSSSRKETPRFRVQFAEKSFPAGLERALKEKSKISQVVLVTEVMTKSGKDSKTEARRYVLRNTFVTSMSVIKEKGKDGKDALNREVVLEAEKLETTK
jgi:hypothetical protein